MLPSLSTLIIRFNTRASWKPTTSQPVVFLVGTLGLVANDAARTVTRSLTSLVGAVEDGCTVLGVVVGDIDGCAVVSVTVVGASVVDGAMVVGITVGVLGSMEGFVEGTSVGARDGSSVGASVGATDGPDGK